ncbi:MAG: isoprenylcysteine carboxylmethyltransferase family protein [Candidatus Nanohalobium sp.]
MEHLKFPKSVDRRSFVFGLLTGLAALTFPSFLNHMLYFLSGQISTVIFRGQWGIVALSIVGFLAFLIPLNYRRRADWRSMGIYSAFIVSLFIEMYGIPLTVYMSSAAFGAVSPATVPNTVLTFSAVGHTFAMNIWMVVGAAITALGMAIVAIGWVTIYRTDRDLVTSGIYRYSRHPQYLGIILIAAGWFIGWPTLLTGLMLPVVIYEYARLCRKEEKEVAEDIGEEKYQAYRESTPMLV